MATQLGYTEINFNKEENTEKVPRRRRNKTIKRKEKKTEKVEDFLNGLEELESMENNSNLEAFSENFTPPSNPTPVNPGTDLQETFADNTITLENFEKLDANSARNQEYYNQFVPYYKQATNNANVHGSRDELMEKLNYIVQVLEETKDEKTENISEELVLYMFLGVFVIFVVDSFAKAGKYTR